MITGNYELFIGASAGAGPVALSFPFVELLLDRFSEKW